MPRYTASDGTKLYYLDEGQGLPLLALPGLTRNGGDFDHVAPHLPVRLIRPDYRGRGQSDWADPASYDIAQETQDILALMDHLDLGQAAVLGTSRGGLIAMTMAVTAKDRLLGVALNDIGPEIADSGLDAIKAYVGMKPAQKTYEEAAEFRATAWTHFDAVPPERWLAEVRNHYIETENALELRYDPRLRDTVVAGLTQPVPDLWPVFDLFEGLPLALIRGANSDLLTLATADEMSRRRPDMLRVDLAGRGHVPFLDEPEALSVLYHWLEKLK